jgi:flagellin-specific chaperone FliS
MKIVEDKLLSKVLSSDEKQRIEKEFDHLYHVNYTELAEAVFGKSKYKLNW